MLSLNRLREILESKFLDKISKQHHKLKSHSGRNLATSKQHLSTSVNDFEKEYGLKRTPKTGYVSTSVIPVSMSKHPILTHKPLGKLVKSRAYDPNAVSRKND